MEKDLLRYYRQRQCKGRSKAARVLDAVLLRLLFVAASYLWFRSNVPNQVAVHVLTAVTTALFLFAARLWRGLRFDRFVQQEQQRLRQAARLEQLMVLPKAAFLQQVQALMIDRAPSPEYQPLAIGLQQVQPVREDDVLRAWRAGQNQGAQHILLYATAPFTPQALALCKRLPGNIIPYGPQELIRHIEQADALPITQTDLDARIRSMQRGSRESHSEIQAQAFGSGRALRYLICGSILFAASFLTGYSLYYRLLAGVCLALAATAFWINKGTPGYPVEQ